MNAAAPEDPIRYEASGSAARITIDREPHRNAITPDVAAGIREGLRRARDDGARAVVLTGAGDRAFSAGGDLGSAPSPGSRQDGARFGLPELFSEMRSCPLPIIARVNGHALGGGFGLMLACDLVVAVDDAEMGTPEIGVGLWPFMITALIQRDVPRKVALHLMMTGGRVGALEGQRWGFVNTVASRADLDGAVDDLLSKLASASPLVISLGKSSFYAAEGREFSDALEHLSRMLALCLQSEDAAEGVSAFLQRRRPEWKGR